MKGKRSQEKNIQQEYMGRDSPLLLVLAFLAIVAMYLALRINMIDIPLDRDEGAFAYIGRLIHDGGLPYRDAVDHKPPSVFYLYALALLFAPATERGIHLFLHAYNFLTLVSVFFLVQARFKSRSAATWSAFAYALFSASPAIQGFTASTEMLMLLPITLGLWFAVLAAQKNSFIFFSLSGIAGALAFWTKQTAITSVLFGVIYAMVSSARRSLDQGSRSWVGALKAMFAWSLGAGVVSCLVGGYFYWKGIFQEFMYWSFTHNLSYVGQMPLLLNLTELGEVSVEILRGDFLIIGIGSIVAFWKLSRRDADSCFVLGFLGFSLLGIFPGYGYRHYFAQLAPAVCIAAGWGLAILLSVVPGARKRLGATCLCGALLIAVPVNAHKQFFFETSPAKISRDYFGDNPFSESKEIGEFIASRTSPNDTIFIFGSEPQILFYSQRRSATSFVMLYPLTSSYPRYLEFQQKAWKEVQSAAPRYVVFVNVPTSTLWDATADLQILNWLDDMIVRDYSIEAVVPLRKGTIGKLFLIDDQHAPPDEITQNKSNIYIYGKKTN